MEGTLVAAMAEIPYEPVLPRSREELEAAFTSHDPSQIHDALISAAYWGQDWRWAQDKCLSFADHASEMVRAGVAYALGLIAVFHAKLDMDIVVQFCGGSAKILLPALMRKIH